jgi:hypothetical protein
MCQYINQQCNCRQLFSIRQVSDGKYEIEISGISHEDVCIAGCLACVLLNFICNCGIFQSK